jgi:hypothetical protein
MKIQQALDTTRYRLRQTKQQLGFVAPLTIKEYQEVAHWLPSSAFALFHTMSLADQRHSLRVCQRLQERGCTERDMLAAALLHDVGKAQGRVPFWTRPAIVIGKRCAPDLLRRLALPPDHCKKQRLPQWRLSLSYAWWHADVGANLAEQAGLSQRAVLYIRTHHQPDGPAAELHAVDDES